MREYTKKFVEEEIQKNPKQIISIKETDTWTIEAELSQIKKLGDSEFTIDLDDGVKSFSYEEIRHIDDPRDNSKEDDNDFK